MLRTAQQRDRPRCLLEHFAQAIDLRLAFAARPDLLGCLMTLVENAGDPAVFVQNGRQTVVPVRLLSRAAPLHGKHLIESGYAFATLEHLPELRLQDVPDIRPDLPRRTAQRPGMLFRRDRGPGVVVEQLQLRSPVDRGRKARVQANAERRTQRVRPAFRTPEGCRSPVERPDTGTHVAAPDKKRQRSGFIRRLCKRLVQRRPE